MDPDYFERLVKDFYKLGHRDSYFMGKLYSTIHLDSVQMMIDSKQVPPPAFRVIRLSADSLFIRACANNSVSVAQWLLDRFGDNIDVEKDNHALFILLTDGDERWIKSRIDAIHLLINRSTWQDYRYVEHKSNYYLINQPWEHGAIKTRYLIDGIHVSCLTAVTLEEATECLHSIKVQKSARVLVE